MRVIGFDTVQYACCPYCYAVIQYRSSELTTDPNTPIENVFEAGKIRCPNCHSKFSPFNENKYDIMCEVDHDNESMEHCVF